MVKCVPRRDLETLVLLRICSAFPFVRDPLSVVRRGSLPLLWCEESPGRIAVPRFVLQGQIRLSPKWG